MKGVKRQAHRCIVVSTGRRRKSAASTIRQSSPGRVRQSLNPIDGRAKIGAGDSSSSKQTANVQARSSDRAHGMSETPRKPIIYFFVLLPVQLCGFLGAILGLQAAYAALHHIRFRDVPNLNAALIGLPAVFLSIPINLLIGNCVLFLIPPLRRIAESYSAKTSRVTFCEAQLMLLRITLYIALVTVPLIVLGFIL
jgi:hypothetical protein